MERRLRTLGQPADVDVHRVRVHHPPDPFGGEDIHHAGRQTAIGDNGDAVPLRLGVELALSEHDLGVAAEIGAVRAHRHGGAGHIEVEIVRRRVEDGVVPTYRVAQRGAVLHVEPREDQACPDVRLEERGNAIGLQVGDRDPLDRGLLQQVIGARGPLQSRAQYQHAHRAKTSE